MDTPTTASPSKALAIPPGFVSNADGTKFFPAPKTTAERSPRHGIRKPDVVKFRIPANEVTPALAKLPEPHRVALRWLEGYCRDKDLTKDEIGRLLKKPTGEGYYSFDSIYQTLTGRRSEAGLSVDNLVNSIEAFRKIADQRDAQISSGFIMTRLSQRIFAVCRSALLRKKIGFVVGDSQIGKTKNLTEFKRQNNHGRTKYIDTPSGCNYPMFLHAWAEEIGILKWKNLTDLKRQLRNSIDDQMLVIVDNIHRIFRGRTDRSLNIFDFIQEIHEATGCGVLLSMTNEGLKEIRTGADSKRLEQIWKRRITPLRLPLATPVDDLALFARAFGLEPATDEELSVKLSYFDNKGDKREKIYKDNPLTRQTAVNEQEGLGVWINLLQTAADNAQESGHTLSWAHVLKAYCLDQANGEIFV